MVHICTFDCCCDDYTKCCNYQCRNKFNYNRFNDLNWSIDICIYLLEDTNDYECKTGICSLIAWPFALVFDIISCPVRCCFEYCNKCECEKITKVSPTQKIIEKGTAKVIITDQPPRYSQHHKHTNFVQPGVTLPPIYTETD